MPLPTPIEIHTPRLTIRPVAAGDLADLLEINGDAEVTRYLPYATWQSMEDATAWLARMDALGTAGSARQLVLVRNSDAKVVGTMLMFRLDEGSARLEIGYVLGRSYWGQGLMSEALRAACAHAFSQLRIRRLEAEVNPLNAASNRLLAACGFTLEGRMRKRWVAKGVECDTNFYGLLAEDMPG